MAFKTVCPYCKEGSLQVISGSFYARGMTLAGDGFCTTDAQSFSTEDEVVKCDLCNKEFPLSEVS
jgi:uncharacterized protein YbaR (Trm112 family)